MRTLIIFSSFIICLNFVLCRDFYMGMFKRNDLLVAQDTVYKERIPYSRARAEYGRLFKCPITYFRVVDRLGMGPGPVVKILKGGLQKKHIAVRFMSGYNLPISVNIYVGCHNQIKLTTTTTSATTKKSDSTTSSTDQPTGIDANGNSTTEGPKAENPTQDTNSDGQASPADAEAEAQTEPQPE